MIIYYIEKTTTTNYVDGLAIDTTAFSVMFKKKRWWSSWDYIKAMDWHSESWKKAVFHSLADAQKAILKHRDSMKTPKVVREVLTEEGNPFW